MRANSAVTAKLKELATENPVKLLFKYSWPALVAMTLNSLYTVVDRAFIGHGCGVDATAALTLSMPIVMLFGAFGVFVGVGHAAVLSIKLGEGDRISCEKLLGQLISLKLLFFFILPPLIYFNLDTVLAWCGASGVREAARESARTYLRIILFSHIFSHLAFGLSAVIRAEGGAVRSMKCMIVGFGLNLVLDPLFIFTFKMGVAGAAWATNIAMAASCLWAFGYYWRRKTIVRLRLKRMWIYPKLLSRAAGIGLAPFLQHFMSSVIAFSLQFAFVKWMDDESSRTAQVASLGVFQSALILVFMPMLGAQQGLQPIIGYNWGAQSYKRVKQIVRCAYIGTAIVGLISTSILFFFPGTIVSLFTKPEDVLMSQIAIGAIRLFSFAYLFRWFVVTTQGFISAIEKPARATVMSVAVALAFPLLMLTALWRMQLDGIWLNFTGVNALAAMLGLGLLIGILREIKRKEQNLIHKDHQTIAHKE